MTPNKPAITADASPARPQRLCPECLEPVAQRGKGKPSVFCCDEHREAHKNRRTVRGKRLVAIAQAWRVDRGSGQVAQACLQQMCMMLDQFNAEDLEAGRMRASDYVMTDGMRESAQDRQKAVLHCSQRHQGCHGKHRPGFGRCNMSDARRAAKADGWNVTPGREACPNCRDDNALVAAADPAASAA